MTTTLKRGDYVTLVAGDGRQFKVLAVERGIVYLKVAQGLSIQRSLAEVEKAR